MIAAGTPEGWGIGVIAGTGSIAVGRTADGRTARAGGWGHLIGDEGSAYAVVLDALRLVARRADGRDPLPAGRDELTERLCAALGVTQGSEIVASIYSPEFDRARMASLAPEVLAACVASPEAARRLLAPAGAALAEMVVAVARSLGWFSGVLPLAAAGGFLLSAPAVLQAMTDGLTQQGYQAAVTLVHEPVRGAVLLAERALAGEGAAVVFATSYLDEAERAAHVLVLADGRELAAGSPEQIVAAMPGRLQAATARPAGPAGARSWRRDGRWRVWSPDGAGDGPVDAAEPVQPDLQDAVTVAILAR